jgi:hypothetical protein
MNTTIKRCVLPAAAALIAACAALAAQAAGDKVGDTQTCVPLQFIDSSPVIDDKTILLKMKGGGYKRIDLLNKCSGLHMQRGFAHSTSTNDLCTSDPLRVLEPVGATCMIDKIVTIDKAEAKELLARQ